MTHHFSDLKACKFWAWSAFIGFSICILFLLRASLNTDTEVIQDIQLQPPRPPAFVPLEAYDLAVVNPNEALSSVPRIQQQPINDRSSNCLKHPSNGVDQNCWNSFRRHQWLTTLDQLYDSPPGELKRFQPNHKWQIFDLITPTYVCDLNSLKRVGAAGDGGKWICGPIRVAGSKCVIFSLGSNNQFDFEEAIDQHVSGKCEIHTFDCTGQWSNPHTKFHSWCLGGADTVDNGRTFRRLSSAAKEVGVTSISLLKMDIEHGEYDVFESLKNEPEEFLPDQIMFELHTAYYPRTSRHQNDWVKTIIDLARDIDSMGYSFAVFERNLLCEACCEYVLVRDRPSTINPRFNATR